MSTTPWIFLIASPTRGPHCRSRSGFSENILITIGSGALVKIADHVLQELRELDVQRGHLLVDLLAHVGDHLVHAAIALAFQLHREIAAIGFRHRGEPKLQAGAARRGLHFWRVTEDSFHLFTRRLVSASDEPAGER